MKKSILCICFSLAILFYADVARAQNSLAPDQNPSFAVSRDKYMNMADSLTGFQSSTVHTTYKAYDWYEAKQERKSERIQFRRQLQLERARNDYRYYEDDFDYNWRNRYRRNYSPFRFRRF